MVIYLPHWLARPMSHLLDMFHFSPMSFGHLELMTRDNVPEINRLASLIALTPKEIGADYASSLSEKSLELSTNHPV
jgi:hypothetical protein